MRERYEVIQTPGGAAWIKSSQFQNLQQVDAIVFDCDGVLVDARRSYDATIPKVVDQILSMTLGIELPWKEFAPRMIAGLRRTGRFNNDWDTTYALILFSVLALPVKSVRELVSSSFSSRTRRFNYSQKVVMANIASLVRKFCCNSTRSGNASETVNCFVSGNMPSKIYGPVIVSVKKQLGYPGSPPNALLSTLFDEVYHGPILFRRMYGVDAQHYRGKGLIKNERILVRRQDLDSANEVLGEQRLAIITGRPYLAAEHVLRDILDYFDVEASLFIGDIDVHPELATKLAAFRKPSGRGLAHVRQTLSSDMLLYVGDSAEDLEMVENARIEEEPALSAGIYGMSVEQSDHLKFFIDRGADLILPTARMIPDVLRLIKDEKRAD
jgi:phosphoglycolate phosphatase-like HAD superfamily hydrolase